MNRVAIIEVGIASAHRLVGAGLVCHASRAVVVRSMGTSTPPERLRRNLRN
jgi:hypothetical protein